MEELQQTNFQIYITKIVLVHVVSVFSSSIFTFRNEAVLLREHVSKIDYTNHTSLCFVNRKQYTVNKIVLVILKMMPA